MSGSGKIRKGPELEILRNGAKLGHRLVAHVRVAADTMTDMVLDQRALGIGDRFLDGRQLHRDIGAGTAFLDHADDALQMPRRSVEAFDDRGMGRVLMWVMMVGHGQISAVEELLGWQDRKRAW